MFVSGSLRKCFWLKVWEGDGKQRQELGQHLPRIPQLGDVSTSLLSWLLHSELLKLQQRGAREEEEEGGCPCFGEGAGPPSPLLTLIPGYRPLHGSCAEPWESINATEQDCAWWQKGDTFHSCPNFLFLVG